MGLTTKSTGSQVLEADIFEKTINCNYTIGLAGNPNVGKSTVFNALTGMHQHTGNWPGKTVSNAIGKCNYKYTNFLFVDIPGTYSLLSNSEEEEIARNYICFGNGDLTVVVVDATSLERNLNLIFQILELTPNAIVCINLLDEAKKKGISIDFTLLSKKLGVPVVGTTARKPKTLDKLLNVVYGVCQGNIICSPKTLKYNKTIEQAIQILTNQLEKLKISTPYLHRWISLKLIDGDTNILSSLSNNLKFDLVKNKEIKEAMKKVTALFEYNNIDINNFRDEVVSTILSNAENISKDVCKYKTKDYNKRDKRIDKILTSKIWGIPIMLGFLLIIFWLTITGANYPSKLLSSFFGFIQENLYILFNYFNAPSWLIGILIDGMYQTLAWVISVMLPPMAIFFPLFTFLEDLGYLPRIAFNLDGCFKKCCASGKQALTMCMGMTDLVIFFSIIGILD